MGFPSSRRAKKVYHIIFGEAIPPNYSSKEDVLITLIRDVLEQFRTEIHMESGSFYRYENVLLSFQYFKRYQGYVLDLCRSGFLFTLLEELNRFHEGIEGTMASSSVERSSSTPASGRCSTRGRSGCPRTPEPAPRRWRGISSG